MIKYITKNSEKLEINTAVALGMFDGVHLGHQEVISKAVDFAKEKNIASSIVTLRNHPRELTKGKAPKLITNLDSRLASFAKLGIDYALILDFDQELMNTSAEDYLEKYLKNILNVSYISSGYDHHFGKGRSGSPELLKTWANKNNIQIDVVDAFIKSDETISSSTIRKLIETGELEKANSMLGHKFLIISKVIEGDKRGRTIGFPTANLVLPEDMVCPAKGVYSAKVRLHDHEGPSYHAVVNVGTRPSFTDSQQIIIEVHILDFNQNIYGKEIELSLETRIRDEKKFNGVSELVEQIKQDIDIARNSEYKEKSISS